MKTYNDVLADGSTYETSLTKLMGQNIKDVRGYINKLGRTPLFFKLTNIVLEDGSIISVEGEHDFPYLSSYPNTPANTLLSEEALNHIYDTNPDND